MEHDLQALDRVFKALADPTRIRILGLLSAGEICVCHIHESLRLPQSLVSRHLAYLRRAGLVESRKEGLWVHYRLASRGGGLTRTLLDAVYHCVGHLTTTAKDGKRLERQTGCGTVAPPAPSFQCCQTRAVHDDAMSCGPSGPLEPAVALEVGAEEVGVRDRRGEQREAT
ncbi:MAG TPA: metalloregulator ArsR/SmtB family transcription factor [Vicinamibacterales bacterium]|nr:metalloregulator ArsR/SmtB family transcription factor [Vicinamibacterales bacterium]